MGVRMFASKSRRNSLVVQNNKEMEQAKTEELRNHQANVSQVVQALQASVQSYCLQVGCEQQKVEAAFHDFITETKLTECSPRVSQQNGMLSYIEYINKVHHLVSSVTSPRQIVDEGLLSKKLDDFLALLTAQIPTSKDFVAKLVAKGMIALVAQAGERLIEEAIWARNRLASSLATFVASCQQQDGVKLASETVLPAALSPARTHAG